MILADRKGNCLIVCVVIAVAIMVAINFYLKKPAKEKKPVLKPVIKSFSADISGKWQARLVKVNAPPRSRPNWKPSWMRDDYRDFDASVEIRPDFSISRLKWVDTRTNSRNRQIEWFSPEKWVYSERNSARGESDQVSEAKRDGQVLCLNYTGNGRKSVKNCRIEFEALDDVNSQYASDGFFREGNEKGKIEAEVILYAPSIHEKKLKSEKVSFELTYHGFEFASNDFTILNSEDTENALRMLKMNSRISYNLLKQFKITKIRGGDIKELEIPGYPGEMKVNIIKCDCDFWFADSSGASDKIFVNLIPGKTEVFIQRAERSILKALVTFDSAGKGRLITHDGAMEYELQRP